ncbi:MAG: group 1 truncated hemoglobin [Vicinamibacterales bacterium]|jgi:hemoglobin
MANVGTETSLYDQLGGSAAVDAAVDIFYRKVLADGRISRFFDDVDMDAQIAKQKAFLTMAFGGPNQYTGTDMRSAHKPLVAKGLNGGHFDAVVEQLGQTLSELGVKPALIAKVAAVAATTRQDVLNA